MNEGVFWGVAALFCFLSAQCCYAKSDPRWRVAHTPGRGHVRRPQPRTSDMQMLRDHLLTCLLLRQASELLTTAVHQTIRI